MSITASRRRRPGAGGRNASTCWISCGRSCPAEIQSTGEIPPSRCVARLLGRADDRTIRSGWDLLTRAGELPSRVAARARRIVADGWLEAAQVLAGFRLTWAGVRLADQLGHAHEVTPFRRTRRVTHSTRKQSEGGGRHRGESPIRFMTIRAARRPTLTVTWRTPGRCRPRTCPRSGGNRQTFWDPVARCRVRSAPSKPGCRAGTYHGRVRVAADC